MSESGIPQAKPIIVRVNRDHTQLDVDDKSQKPLAHGRTVASGSDQLPPALLDTEWWVDWVRAYPLDKSHPDPEQWEIDREGGKRKQPVAPYQNGHARPVGWQHDLPPEQRPTTDPETVAPWTGLRLGYDLPKPERVVSDTLRPGVILPVDREAENPDGITIIDWDDVRDPETGETHPVVIEALEECDSYAAISQSGEGIHQWVYGEIPDGSRKFLRDIGDEPFVPGSDDLPQVEIYTTGRLVGMTGRHIEGTGNDVADGQELIDRLCWRFGTGTNNSPGTPTDPFGRRVAGPIEPGADLDLSAGAGGGNESVPSTEIVGDAMREAVAYDGPDPEEWEIPEDDPRSLDYHAVLRARERSDELPSTANWELIGYAAAIGYDDGLDQEEILADLQAHPTPNHGYRPSKAEPEVKSVFRKAENDQFGRPSRRTLVERGILPERFAEENTGDDVAEDGELIALLPELPEIDSAPTRTSFGSLEAEADVDVEIPDSDETAPDRDDESESGDAPSLDDARGRVVDTIRSIMQRTGRGAQAVVDALMGTGKTYGAFLAAHLELANGRGGNGVLYVSGRKELYEQAEQYALDVGFDEEEIYILPSPEECPTFDGAFGGEWEDRVWKLYQRGAHASTIHKLLADELPCCDTNAEDPDALCPYEARNKFDPEDYEVIIGHYKHAHIDHILIGRQVIVDENPTDAFMTEVGGGALKEGINAFLSLDDSPAVDGFDDLLAARHDPEQRAEALQWFGDFDFEPDERNTVRFEDRGFHAYAPHAVYTFLSAEPVGGAWDYDNPDLDPDDYENGRRYPFEKCQLPGIGNEAMVYTTSDELRRTAGAGGDDYYIQIQTPPDLDFASSIIALDGTPLLDDWTDAAATRGGERPAEWELALGRPLDRERIMSDDERERFLRETMGHTYIQTSEHVRPYSSAKYHDPVRDAALLAQGSQQYLDGQPWEVVITSKDVADEYRYRGFADPDSEPRLANRIDHRGNVRGSDAYAQCKSGAVLGSSHHGDHEIARSAAWLDEQVNPQGKGVDRTYGDAGDAALEQQRELDTAQTALRIGRGEHGRGAVVLVDTCAIPDWLPIANDVDAGEIPEISVWTETERAVCEIYADAASAAEVNDGDEPVGFSRDELLAELRDRGIDPSKRHVRRVLSRHDDRGLIEWGRDPDDGRRSLWLDAGISDLTVGDMAGVELPDGATESIEDDDDDVKHVNDLVTGQTTYRDSIREMSGNQIPDTFPPEGDDQDRERSERAGPLALTVAELQVQPMYATLDPPPDG